MKNLSLLVFFSFLLSCNSKTTTKETKTETTPTDTVTKHSAINIVDPVSDSSTIYDTLESPGGELLNEKFESSQPELKYYKQFINSKRINETVVLDEPESKTEARYLGQIKDLNKKTSYHVIANFTVLITMLSPRGISKVAFINQEKDKIIIYRLNMPDELPKYIENNMLYFETGKTKIGLSISGGLPPYLCIPKIGCY